MEGTGEQGRAGGRPGLGCWSWIRMREGGAVKGSGRSSLCQHLMAGSAEAAAVGVDRGERGRPPVPGHHAEDPG